MFIFLLKAWSGDMVEPLHARQDTESLSAGGKTSGGERDKKMPESLEIPASGGEKTVGRCFPTRCSTPENLESPAGCSPRPQSFRRVGWISVNGKPRDALDARHDKKCRKYLRGGKAETPERKAAHTLF